MKLEINNKKTREFSKKVEFNTFLNSPSAHTYIYVERFINHAITVFWLCVYMGMHVHVRERGTDRQGELPRHY